MQTPRKVPYIGHRSRRLDEISGLSQGSYSILRFLRLQHEAGGASSSLITLTYKDVLLGLNRGVSRYKKS